MSTVSIRAARRFMAVHGGTTRRCTDIRRISMYTGHIPGAFLRVHTRYGTSEVQRLVCIALGQRWSVKRSIEHPEIDRASRDPSIEPQDDHHQSMDRASRRSSSIDGSSLNRSSRSVYTRDSDGVDLSIPSIARNQSPAGDRRIAATPRSIATHEVRGRSGKGGVQAGEGAAEMRTV